MNDRIVELAVPEYAALDADRNTIADATLRAVGALLVELRPLVGELAMRALCARGLHLARASFVLPVVSAKTETIDALLEPLRRDLAGRDPPDAIRAGRALLNALVDLLVSLIGEHLTHRMLRSAWGQSAPTLPQEKPQ